MNKENNTKYGPCSHTIIPTQASSNASSGDTDGGRIVAPHTVSLPVGLGVVGNIGGLRYVMGWNNKPLGSQNCQNRQCHMLNYHFKNLRSIFFEELENKVKTTTTTTTNKTKQRGMQKGEIMKERKESLLYRWITPIQSINLFPTVNRKNWS